MANTKALQNKKLALLKTKASVEALVAGYAEKLTKIDADIAEIETSLQAEVAELQKMIDEIKNGSAQKVEETKETESGDFN